MPLLMFPEKYKQTEKSANSLDDVLFEEAGRNFNTLFKECQKISISYKSQ